MHDAAYNFTTLQIFPNDRALQIMVELRGGNSTRSTMHIQLKRDISVWWDVKPPPDPEKYDIFVYMDDKFQKLFYDPLCGTKISKKQVGNPDKRTGIRKSQVMAHECLPILVEIMLHYKWKYNLRSIVRNAQVQGGKLEIPLTVVRRATLGLKMQTTTHKDFAALNQQRVFVMLYCLMINIKSGKINWKTGEVNEKKQWRLKPSCLDAHSTRLGFRKFDKNQLRFSSLCL